MDIKRSGWFGHLEISGISEPIKFHGSIREMMQQVIIALMDVNPRATAAGSKKVIFHISEQPITAESLALQKRAAEVDSLIDESLITIEQPNPGETFDEFVTRLTSLGYNSGTAAILAADAFNIDIPDSTNRWLTDPQAVRFRQLHASQKSYDSADPHELAQLDRYIREGYPIQYAGMHRRS